MSIEMERPASTLRWWHWLAFFLPTLVAVGTTVVLNANGRAKFASLTHPTDSDIYWMQHMGLYNGMAGMTGGAVCCLFSGTLIGLTCKADRPVLACFGWTLACTLTNAVLSLAGCGCL